MKNFALLTLLILTFNVQAAGPLRTAENVDVSRYVGKWYALYSLPQFFTRNCVAQTAEYGILNEQTISVLNTCFKQKGKSTIKGEAVVTNPQTNAELEVTFNTFWTRLFRVKGDYNIITLDLNYEFVMVGSRDRKSLWIMSRSTSIPQAKLDEYLMIAKEEGFNTGKLVKSKF